MKQYTQEELWRMQIDYSSMTVTEFRKVYNMGFKTIYELFGKKTKIVCGRKPLQLTPEEFEEAKKDYFSMSNLNFMSKWKVSTVKAIEMFGTKTGVVPKRYNVREKERVGIDSNKKKVMEKFGIQSYEYERLNETFTFTEMMNGELINGKLKPKELVKIYK